MSAILTSLGPERLVAIDGDVDAAALGGIAALRLGPREWLALDAVAATLAPMPDALAVDVGDAYEGWRLEGAGSAALLAKACPLDLDRLAAGAATRTVMAGVSVIVRVVGPERFELRVETSYAAWLEAWLRQL